MKTVYYTVRHPRYGRWDPVDILPLPLFVFRERPNTTPNLLNFNYFVWLVTDRVLCVIFFHKLFF